MVSCHSLVVLDGKMQGDPLDMKMFEATHWVKLQVAYGRGGGLGVGVGWAVRKGQCGLYPLPAFIPEEGGTLNGQQRQALAPSNRPADDDDAFALVSLGRVPEGGAGREATALPLGLWVARSCLPGYFMSL